MDNDYDVKTFTGSTRKQSELLAAFNLVANKDNWKNPIDVILDYEKFKADALLFTDAIVHFTGSTPSYTMTKEGVLVKADGYYIAVGA